jgi:flavodoxin
MNVLIVYYSRTGTTKKIAEQIQSSLNTDIDEIKDIKSRSGIIGWLQAGRDSISKNLTNIKEINFNPADFDLVIIGSPTWNGAASTPIRTYITQYKDQLRNVALFSTGLSTEPKALEEMENLIKGKSIAKLHLNRKEDLEHGDYHKKIEDFIQKIKTQTKSP